MNLPGLYNIEKGNSTDTKKPGESELIGCNIYVLVEVTLLGGSVATTCI